MEPLPTTARNTSGRLGGREELKESEGESRACRARSKQMRNETRSLFRAASMEAQFRGLLLLTQQSSSMDSLRAVVAAYGSPLIPRQQVEVAVFSLQLRPDARGFSGFRTRVADLT